MTRSTISPPELDELGVPVLAIEAGGTLGWDCYVGPAMAVVGVDRFGPPLRARS
jgi:transketolase